MSAPVDPGQFRLRGSGRRFYETLAEHGSSVALVHGDQQISYEELARTVAEIGSAIGSRRELVFLEAQNEPASIATYLACLRGGHPVYLFGQADDKLDELDRRYKPDRTITIVDGVPQHRTRAQPARPIAPDLRLLLSTSGSTGSPKLVKLSGQNLDANAVSIVDYLRISPRDRAATTLPFHYSFGLSIVNSHLSAGAALILTSASVVDAEFWDEARRHRVTSISGVPYSFELLRGLLTPWYELPSLRAVTQAGGRLAPDMVRELASLGEANSWLFYVMYGQTEASPRMAYLPPAMAARHPGHIGIPVPGGQFEIIGEDGAVVRAPGVSGELAYRGPNVMMGYALEDRDLATDDTPPRLMTGDVARRNEAGLYEIIGRTARFVKPFGLRINLDEVEAEARTIMPGAVSAGDDRQIVIAASGADPSDLTRVAAHLARRYRLPGHAFRCVQCEAIPRLPNGKVDYRSIMDGAAAAAAVRSDRPATVLGTVLSEPFLRQFVDELKEVLGLSRPEWSSVAAILEEFTGRNARPESSFRDLGGDSLSYVQVATAIEHYLGHLPERWEFMSVDALERQSRHEAIV